MKVVIIGASHGGIHAASTIKKIDPKAEVVLIEKRSNISYISSGIILKIKQLIPSLEEARCYSMDELKELNLDILLNSEVIEIDPVQKEVHYQNKEKQTEKMEYDKLILATGSNQFSLNLELPSKDKVATFKDYDSSKAVLEKIDQANEISIIGGGYIGVELSDALKNYDKKINLIESAESILFRYLDHEVSHIIEQRMKEYGIHLHLNENVLSFEEIDKQSFITKTTNKEISNEFVIIGVNARPDTSLIQEFLDLNANGTIRVNEKMQTTNPDIYALGDAVSYPVQNSHRQSFVPLVNNVVRSATVAAMNVMGCPINYHTTQKTTASHVFGFYVASTGLTETEARFEGIETDSIFLKLPHKLSYMKGQSKVYVKLVVEKESNQLIGGQLLSERDITQSINVVSLAISQKLSIEELITTDFYFNPMINQPMGIIGRAAYEFVIRQNSRA